MLKASRVFRATADLEDRAGNAQFDGRCLGVVELGLCADFFFVCLRLLVSGGNMGC